MRSAAGRASTTQTHTLSDIYNHLKLYSMQGLEMLWGNMYKSHGMLCEFHAQAACKHIYILIT